MNRILIVMTLISSLTFSQTTPDYTDNYGQPSNPSKNTRIKPKARNWHT